MQHYRHRVYLGIAPGMVMIGLIATPFWVMWGASISEWLETWQGFTLLWGLAAWYWLVTVRWINREVVVDDTGLWIDGELELHAADIAAISFLDDPFSTVHLARIEDGRVQRFRLVDTLLPARWRNRVWWRVVAVPGHGQVVIPREHDTGRASALDGVVVVSRRSDPRLPGARTGWLLGTYRLRALGEALLTVAPDADVVAGTVDVRGE